MRNLHKYMKKNYALEESILIPTGSITSIQCKDDGPFTHCIIFDHGELNIIATHTE